MKKRRASRLWRASSLAARRSRRFLDFGCKRGVHVCVRMRAASRTRSCITTSDERYGFINKPGREGLMLNPKQRDRFELKVRRSEMLGCWQAEDWVAPLQGSVSSESVAASHIVVGSQDRESRFVAFSLERLKSVVTTQSATSQSQTTALLTHTHSSRWSAKLAPP